MAAAVAEATLARGLLTHVPVFEHGELVGKEFGDGDDIALDVGNDADADLVSDFAEGLAVDGLAVAFAGGFGGKRFDALGPTGHGEVVDAGLVEDPPDEADEAGGDRTEFGVQHGIPGDGCAGIRHGCPV